MSRKSKEEVEDEEIEFTSSLPFDKETTRNYFRESEFPSMHSDTPHQEVVPVSCRLCGMTFGLYSKSGPKPIYCPFHNTLIKRLGTKKKITERSTNVCPHCLKHKS